MFSSLKVKNYRMYWIGMFVSLIGTWIQMVAQSWLVYQLTHSAFLLGVVGFLSALPIFLFTLFAGAVADRVHKKNILLVTQTLFMALAFALAVLTQLGLVRIWHIMAIAVATGMVMAFDAPCRQAMVIELVGKEHLMNAIALNSVAFNSARIIGPALAGIMVAGIGMSGCFYINAVSFLAVLVALAVIRIQRKPAGPQGMLVQDIREGLRFMRGHPLIRTLITMMGIMSLFGLSYVILMPLFADRVLHAGVAGLGVLMSSAGVGALVAALMLARLGDYGYKGRLLTVALVVFTVALILFAFSTSMWQAVAAIALVGWSSVACAALINTLLQVHVPDGLRGRVMSGFMFTFAGVMPFGNLLGGALAQAWGVAWAVGIGGMICGCAFGALLARHPEIQKL